MHLIEVETLIMDIAAEELGLDRTVLKPETRLDQIFDDSLDYLEFTVRLQDLGYLSEESISKCETIGDLANALVHPN